MAAPSSYVKTGIMGALKLKDGTGSPVELVIPFSRGDLAIGGLGHKLNELVKIEARGKFISAAYAARRYPSIAFSMWLGNIIGNTNVAPGSVSEFLAGGGAYSANVSTQGSGSARPMTVDVEFSIEGSNFGDTYDELVTINDLHGSWNITEALEGNSLAFTGEALGDVVVTHNTNTLTFAQIA